MYLEDESEITGVESSMEAIAPTLGTKVGLSDCFENLIECCLRFLQANRSLDIGMARQPGDGVYSFSDFVLFEMIEGATSEISIELLSPPGLTRLVKHGKETCDSLRAVSAVSMEIGGLSKDMLVTSGCLCVFRKLFAYCR